MIPILFRQEEKLSPLQTICPYLDFVDEDHQIILNKDGSLLAGFTYEGINPDDCFAEKINFVTNQLQRSFSVFDRRLSAWWIIDKVADDDYLPNQFINQTAQQLDAIYSQRFCSNQTFKMHYRLYLLFTDNQGTDRFLDRLSRFQNESNKSFLSAFFLACKESLSDEKAFVKDVATLQNMVVTFKEMIASFIASAPLLLKPLMHHDFMSELSYVLNRGSFRNAINKAPMALMDAFLPRDEIVTGENVIAFQGDKGVVYAAAVAIKKWPEDTTSALLESLLKAPYEMSVCQIIRFLNTTETTKEIQKAIEYYELTKYSLVGHAIAKAVGVTATAQSDKVELLSQCEQARNLATVDGVNFAYMNMTVFVYDKQIPRLNQALAHVSRELSLARFNVIRERLNTFPSFCAMLPGQWAMQSRYDLVSLENVSDMAPIYTIDEGDKSHSFFSEIFQKEVPPLAVFGNSYGGKRYFSSHVGQVGHMVIIAPTGGGKTTFVNFCLSQFQRYGRVNTFVFDRNHSCQIVTELHDGVHIDLKNDAHLNPFFALDDGSSDGKYWLREFIIRRLAEGNYVCDAQDRLAIDRGIELIAQSNRKRLSELAILLPHHLRQELSEWLSGRPYGMFDHDEDQLSLSHWTTIELLEIMGIERLSRAFMDYVFRKIFVSLDGTPTLIYLEEASFLLQNETFLSMIDDWLKTFRKKNAFVWLTIQSPEAITHQTLAASITDNIKSFLLLPNERIESHRQAYRQYFGLTDHQIDQLAQLVPHHEYLLVQDGKAHILKAHFEKDVLAYIRSEASVLNTYNRIKQSGAGDWKAQYLKQMSAM